MERMRSHDQGFVAAPPGEVYAVISRPETYPGWWAGSKLGDDGLTIPVVAGAVRAQQQRDGVGLHLVCGEGSLEWYLEPFDDGTIVNAFLDVRAYPSEWRGRRKLVRLRGAVRRGLTGLKGSLEAKR